MKLYFDWMLILLKNSFQIARCVTVSFVDSWTWRVGPFIINTGSEMLASACLGCTWRCSASIRSWRASLTRKVLPNSWWESSQLFQFLSECWRSSSSLSWFGVWESCTQVCGVAFVHFSPSHSFFWLTDAGLFGFTWEVICLILCVGSIWAPGSPFDPSVPIYSRIEDPFVRPHQLDPNITEYVEFDRTAPNGDRTSITILRAGICSARLGSLPDISQINITWI